LKSCYIDDFLHSIAVALFPQGVYHKNFDLVSQSFSQFIEKGYTLYILSDSEKQIERLQAIFEERGDSISLKLLHR